MGYKSYRRKDQTIRGTTKGLKTAFVVPFSQTEGRLDPPFYLWRYQSQSATGRTLTAWRYD